MKKNGDASETGSAGVKLLLFLLAMFLIVNAILNYVPVAYAAESLKDGLNASVLQALAVPTNKPGNTVEFTKKRVEALLRTSGVPEDTFLDVQQVNGVLEVNVSYTKDVEILPFGIYKYEYQFDYTAKPGSFLIK